MSRPPGRVPEASRGAALLAACGARRSAREGSAGAIRRSGPGRVPPPRAAMELEELGIREECGVFGCIASGVWPTELDVPHVITLGLVGLQHR